MKFRSNTAPYPPVDLSRGILIGTSDLLRGRDPSTVRRWVVEWSKEGDVFALAGPLDWCVDLGNALYALRGPEKVDCVFLWPGVPGMPAQPYVTARETLQLFMRSDVAHEGWAAALREVDFELPEVFALAELSERVKSRRRAA